MSEHPEDAALSEKFPKDKVADDGVIHRSSTAQTIMAVAFLIIVTLVAFVSVTIIGRFMGETSHATYWMIELIFALLCGGAGALVGGSAVVRSTLKIPGSPVQATMGGAISMVIVGFWVAWLGSPPIEEPVYTVSVLNIPQPDEEVDGARYNVYIGTTDQNVSVTQGSSTATIKVPTAMGTYRVRIELCAEVGDGMKG